MNLRELYMVLREQIRDHDATLEAMRALARATLAVSAVVLGIMIISLGNLVALVNDGRLGELFTPAKIAALVAIAAALHGRDMRRLALRALPTRSRHEILIMSMAIRARR